VSETLLIVGVRKLGRSTALHFARKGWRVLGASRTAADVEALARDVNAAGGQGVPVVCDLQRPETLARFGEDPPDLIIAAQTMGGRFGALPLLEIPADELAQSLAAYPQGTWNLLRAVGPAMLARGRGSFLQIGTSSGVRTKEDSPRWDPRSTRSGPWSRWRPASGAPGACTSPTSPSTDRSPPSGRGRRGSRPSG
jgi:NAD(P)-dependent dehydrogenase (short-subunit alcohol dehydrogenase family)